MPERYEFDPYAGRVEETPEGDVIPASPEPRPRTHREEEMELEHGMPEHGPWPNKLRRAAGLRGTEAAKAELNAANLPQPGQYRPTESTSSTPPNSGETVNDSPESEQPQAS